MTAQALFYSPVRTRHSSLALLCLSLTVLFSPLLSPAPALCHDAEVLRVKIRALRAIDSVPSDLERPERRDKRLDDLRPKLEVLARKYAHYELSCSQQAEIEMNKKTDLKLANGHTVSIRPMHHSDEHLLRVKWTAPNGMKLLDTRLRFDRSHSQPYAPVLAGAEISETEGVILAIEVFE